MGNTGCKKGHLTISCCCRGPSPAFQCLETECREDRRAGERGGELLSRLGGDAAPAWGLMEGGRPPRSGARDPSQREAGYAAGSSGTVASAGFMQST